MGRWEFHLTAFGAHGAQREKGHGELVDHLWSDGPEGLLAALVEHFKDIGQTIEKAEVIHWPDGPNPVHDDLLSGVRGGSFSEAQHDTLVLAEAQKACDEVNAEAPAERAKGEIPVATQPPVDSPPFQWPDGGMSDGAVTVSALSAPVENKEVSGGEAGDDQHGSKEVADQVPAGGAAPDDGNAGEPAHPEGEGSGGGEGGVRTEGSEAGGAGEGPGKDAKVEEPIGLPPGGPGGPGGPGQELGQSGGSDSSGPHVEAQA